MNLKKAIKEYLETKKHLRGFATYRSCTKHFMETINLSTIDLAGDLTTTERKKRIRKTRELFRKVDHNLRKKSKNTRFFTINQLKSVLIFVEEEVGMVFWKAYKVEQEFKEILILDADFTKSFIRDDRGVYDTLTPAQKTVWEIAAVSLTTSLRFGDAKALNMEGLRDGKVIVKNEKTGVTTACPIPPMILDKLMANQAEFGRLYSKEMSEDSCYDHLPSVLKNYDELKKTINGEPLHDIIKFHVFRKTAISLSLAGGVPEAIVKQTSGHAANSRAFGRYVTTVTKLYDEQMNNFQSNFYGTV